MTKETGQSDTLQFHPIFLYLVEIMQGFSRRDLKEPSTIQIHSPLGGSYIFIRKFSGSINEQYWKFFPEDSELVIESWLKGKKRNRFKKKEIIRFARKRRYSSEAILENPIISQELDRLQQTIQYQIKNGTVKNWGA